MKYPRQASLLCPAWSLVSRNRPTSQRMKAIYKEVIRTQLAYRPPIVSNRINNANRRYDVENKAYIKVAHLNHRPNTFSASKTQQTPLGNRNFMLPDKNPVPVGKSMKAKLDRRNHLLSSVSKRRHTNQREDFVDRKKSIERLHHWNLRWVVPSCTGNNIKRNEDPSVKDDGRAEYKYKNKRKEILESDDNDKAENCRPVKKRGKTIRNAITKDLRAKVSTPIVSKSVDMEQSSSLPIDKPIWSGIFKIGAKDYVSLSAHLSTKSCAKVWELSRSLLPLVKITKVSRLEAWPKSFEASGPTADKIGLYFFPHDMRHDDDLHRLVKEVMENDMVLRAVVDEAEMLILPSILLPKQYQTFQGKHYLWGLFKRRGDKTTPVGEQQQHGTGPSCAHNEEMGKDQPDVSKEDHERMAPPLAGSDAPTCPDENAAANAAATSADDQQNRTGAGVSQGGLFGFVVRRTPRLEQLIHEMEREGAVVFAMQGEMVGRGQQQRR